MKASSSTEAVEGARMEREPLHSPRKKCQIGLAGNSTEQSDGLSLTWCQLSLRWRRSGIDSWVCWPFCFVTEGERARQNLTGKVFF